jgi:hypothetical protein
LINQKLCEALNNQRKSIKMKKQAFLLIFVLSLITGKMSGQCNVGLIVGGGGAICSGTVTIITVELSEIGTSYQLRNNAGNINIGSPVVGDGGTISFPTGILTEETTFNVLSTVEATCSAQLTMTATVTINALPTPGISITENSGTVNDGTVCAGTSVILTASGGTGYLWDGSISNGAPFIPAATTTYTVTVTNADGCTQTASQIVTVNPLPVVTFITQPGAGTVCEGADVTYTTQSGMSDYIWGGFGTPGTDYSITFGGISLTDQTVTLKWLTTGSKTVTVNYSNTGCTAASATSSITTTVNPLTGDPVFTVGATSVCKDADDETYTATAANSTSIAYSVYPSGSSGAGTMNSSTGVMNWKSTFSGTATITATATGLCGTTTTDRIVTVYPSAPAQPGSITGSSPVCQGQTGVSYSIAAVTNAMSYQWTVTSGCTITSGQGTVSITVDFAAGATNQTISVRGQNTCGLGSVRNLPVTVNPTPTATIAGTTTVCQGSGSPLITFHNPQTLPVTITYNINGASQTTINVGSGTNSTVAAPTSTSGTFIYTLVSVAYQGGGATCPNNISGTATVIVTPVVGTPTAITVSAGSDPSCQITNSSTSTTYATTASNSTSFDWSLSNGAAGSINTGTGVMTWANGFSGSVNIQVTASGCGTSSQVIKTVSITPSVGLPTSITIASGIEPSCQLTDGTTTTNYSTTAANSTGFNWSLSNAAAGSIDPVSGVMTWANGFSGSVNVQVTASGCGTSSQVIRTVNVTPHVGTPTSITVSAGIEPTCKLTNSTTTTSYSTTATNYTGFNWSLSDGTAGTINASSGVMTWANGFSGSVNIQVTATGCNSTSSQVIRTVNITPAPGVPTAITISAGSDPVCQLTNSSTMTIYSTTATNSTAFNWSLSNVAAGSINTGTGVMNWANGFSGSVDIRVTASGCGTSSQVIRTVNVTPLPVPTISGPSIVRVTSVGNIYSTEGGMTNYIWTVSSGGSVTGGGTTTDNTATVNWLTSGAQSVSMRYTMGTCTSAAATLYNITVNSLPLATNVTITGVAAIGNLLTASYTYSDVSPEGTSTYRWLRDGVIPIGGATGLTYIPTITDLNKTITFEVTPVTSTGTPNSGVAVKSTPTGTVENLSEIPVASEVCIEGVRAAGNILRGKYKYTHSKPEGTSTYQWYRGTDAIPGATGIQYTLLQVEDINSDAETIFKVTPISSNIIPVLGTVVASNPLSKITLPQDEYSVAVSEVTLTANQSGGVFSGPGVTNGKFSPSSVGIVGSPYTIQYLLNIVNTSTTCSQTSTKQVAVVTNTTSFSGVNPVYCHDGGEDVISISGLPGTATSLGFSITNPNGIISQTNTTVIIDPGKMRPGNNVDVLTFNYLNLGYFYQIRQPLVIDSVGSDMNFINLNDAYCSRDAKQTISVIGVYPQGGSAVWTGTLLSDLKTTSSVLDPTVGTAGQTYPITYQYKTASGCYGSMLTRNVSINALPNPAFTLDPTYNIDGGAKILVPVQTGGSFSGNGISGNRFFPDIAGLGEYDITYNITDLNNCSDSRTQKTTIRKAQGSFIDLPALICYRDTTYNVKVIGLPAGITVVDFTNKKNSIVHSPGATNADYKVTAAGSGIDTLIFSYKLSSVDYSISTVVNIDSLGQVKIQNLFPGDVICNNVSPFELVTSLKGGVFTGPVTGGYLDPVKALGSAIVLYKYTSQKTGCTSSIDIPITIISAPVISFVPADYCIENKSDSTRFINNTSSAGLITDWLWEFSDAGGSLSSTKKEPSYLYKTGGLHPVTLSVKTTNNCSVTKTISLDLGVKPTADFYWKNDCFHLNESLQLFDTTFSTSAVASRTWNFFDGGPMLSGTTVSYPKTAAGYIKVQHIVNTNYANCADTISKNIYIRPSVSLASDSYFQDFETGNGGWVKSYADTSNSWSFGKPDRTVINTAASGNNAWFTKYPLVNQKIESSSIVSPCFDFTSSERPMISLKLWRRFDLTRDGAALQYKIKDEKDWHYVGTLDDGINWFNSAVIKGKPGGEPLGWTIKDNGWIESRHTLDELKNKKDVKFRIAYGSDGTSTDNDGIAFDDIWIGERSRKVLLEHFANSSSTQSKDANVMVNNIVSAKPEDVINIQYHTNFPGTDPFYNENPGDASARILFYGLIKTPYSFIDGGNDKLNYAKNYDYNLANIDSNDVTRRSLVNPRFDISLTTAVSGGILTVSGKLNALEAINSDNLTLFIAVTEKKNTNHTGMNGETIFYNVFRKFIPDAGGISLKKTWAKGDSYTLAEKSWVVEKILNTTDIEVVAFVQNSITKELYQATSEVNTNILVGIENLAYGKVNNFALYPNPAVNKLTIVFEEPLAKDAEITIYDLQGTIIKSYKAVSGISEFPIDNLGLKGGIYMIRITSSGVNLGFRKLIVSGY